MNLIVNLIVNLMSGSKIWSAAFAIFLLSATIGPRFSNCEALPMDIKGDSCFHIEGEGIKRTKTYAVKKTDEEWKKELPAEVYQVARQGGTEPAFSGKYWNNHNPGIYRCACCGAELFNSDTKFDSGTGWPSFFAPVKKDAIDSSSDHTLGMVRTEVICSHCGAHLGHVFPDGPKPTGLRFCINSGALKFEEKK
jgi:peptide-methionine (R)-S-oxide reductase